MGSSGGWPNWRLRSGRRRTDRSRSDECSYRRPTANSGRWASPHARRTALRSRQPLGSAEVTHPFHPLRGQRFVVLKLRRVSGVETLSLRHPDLGSFAMRREWTDWAAPDAGVAPAIEPIIIDPSGLVALADLVESIFSRC